MYAYSTQDILDPLPFPFMRACILYHITLVKLIPWNLYFSSWLNIGYICNSSSSL